MTLQPGARLGPYEILAPLGAGGWARATGRSPDGSRVYFSSNRKGRGDLYVKPASGSGGEKQVLHSEAWVWPSDCSRDGRFLVFTMMDLTGGREGGVWVLPLSGEKKATALAGEKMKEPVARFSPDSRWDARNRNAARPDLG